MKHINEDDEIRVLGGNKWKGEEVSVRSPRKRKLWPIVTILILLFVVAGIFAYKIIDHRYYGFDYPLSRQQQEVINSLQNEHKSDSVGIGYSTDTYLGVDLKFYKISGLKAEMRDSFPSLDDKEVYLVTRSSDYRIDGNKNKIIGDYVIGGNLIAKSNWRAGYFAIMNGNVEIGIGRRPDMRTFLLENKGSMFRQFALVSAGVKCVSQYVLKGKVERCAYVRMPNNELYFIETVNPETLYGFSDALIEFGAVDAIYITGGSQKELFYRDTCGERHGDYIDDKAHQMVVWTKK